ncbi:MAG: YbbR-like domain-containing protein [Chloroflexota bacterium]
MRRFVGFVVHNWPLKLGAVVLATLLYAGLVLSQNAQVWAGRVPIVPVNQSPSVFILGSLGEVHDVRLFAPRDAFDRLSSASFSAFVDLAGVVPQPGSSFVTVPVQVRVADGRVQVLDFDPRQIQIRLDPLVSKTVPVEVDRGTVPPGLEVRDPVLEVRQVTVSGPRSAVSQVVQAVARVLIQPSGISIDQAVDLVAVDGRGEPVSQVRLDPAAVRVRILVGNQLVSKSLPVNPVVVGTPGVGFEVGSVTVSPVVVTVEGDASVLAELARIDTNPVSLSGAVADFGRTIDLALPDGVALLGDATVRVSVRIRPTMGSRTISAGIVLAGERTDRTYSLSTDRVLVTVGGAATDLDQLDARSLVVVADVTDLEPGGHEVTLRAALPSRLSLVAIAPARIIITVGLPVSASPSAPPGP